jgi:hypothetical protein
MVAHHSPSPHEASGSCIGIITAHHSWVFGPAAILAQSSSALTPYYSKELNSMLSLQEIE